jgi:uncharacterized membrane protein
MANPEVKTDIKIPAFDKINSAFRLLICISVAVVAFFIIDIEHIDMLTRVMVGWDIFSLCIIVMSWITFFITAPEQIRAQAKEQDPTSPIIFIIILVATLASLLAVLILIITKKEGNSGASYRLPIAFSGMVFSWFLIHTLFALRYAHLFYGDSKTKPEAHAGGLEFPGDELPGYLDFAYFSFVLGMTFQVSDVEIASKKLRHLALVHGLISYGFGTTMIALVINLIAGYGT